MLKILIEAVLLLGKQELSFRGHDEKDDSLNKGNYRELLECFTKFDSVFERRLHGRLAGQEGGNAGAFTGVSSEIQNDLIDCIDSVIQDVIDQEVKECTFLSTQVDETTDVSAKEQLSVIIRLDRKGEIVERFLRFVDVSADRSASAISGVVKNILHKYGESLRNKLIMQTYDGASVMSGHIAGVQALVREDYPLAHFFHCAAHKLSLVLCQSASSISAVKVFFANVSAFSNFTSLSSRRKELFVSRGIDIPRPGDTRWYYRGRTISVIFHKYQALLDILEDLVENTSGWDDATLSQASGLLQYLNSFLFCFLTGIFNKILEQSTILYKVLQNRKTDYSYGVSKVKDFGTFLSDLRSNQGFENIFSFALEIVGQPTSRSDKKVNYKQLYFQIIDNLVQMLEDRFEDCENFSFLDLVNPNFFSQWKDNFPKRNSNFCKADMVAFLIFLCWKPSCFLSSGTKISKKHSSMELLEYMYDFELHTCFPKVIKLLKLNAVIAVSSASAERSFSCQRRVKTYLRKRMGQERLASLSRISIQKDVLKELENEGVLYRLITEKFIQKPRRLSFLFK